MIEDQIPAFAGMTLGEETTCLIFLYERVRANAVVRAVLAGKGAFFGVSFKVGGADACRSYFYGI